MGTIELSPVNEAFSTGTPIGFGEHAGVRRPVCIPLSRRRNHVHIIGRPGTGKSTLVEQMILDDVRRGAGVAVFDPHGGLVDRLLRQLPERQIPRVIYFNPGDPEWVPLWNPLQRIPGQDAGRMADDLVWAFKSLVDGRGDRLEHLLRNVFYTALCLPRSTLLDVSNMLREQKNDDLWRAMMQAVDNESARQFWQNDYRRYRKDDFGPPRNKLSKLLLTGTVSLMLSQPKCTINFREIMDGGMVLLVDLSGVGPQVRDILGPLMFALMHVAALGRSARPGRDRSEFHIYCDEGHRFVDDALETGLAELRMLNVSLVLTHQHMGHFASERADALAGVGTTVIFNIDAKDAQQLAACLPSRVGAGDLMNLELGQAVARIGNEVLRIRTPPPALIPSNDCRNPIIEHSRTCYYKPAHEGLDTGQPAPWTMHQRSGGIRLW